MTSLRVGWSKRNFYREPPREVKNQEPFECLAEPYMEPLNPTIEYKSVQEDSALLTLPIEILEIIFQHLDLKSLVRLSSTCSLLFNIARETSFCQIFDFHDSESACRHFMDIGVHFLTPLWSLFPSPPSGCDSYLLKFPWKQIFKCGEIWNSIHNWKISLQFVVNIVMDEITSVDVAGQYVVIGSRKGALGLWNPDKDEGDIKRIFEKSIEVDQVIVQLSPDCEKEDIHYRILTHFKDTSIAIHDMTGYSFLSGPSYEKDLTKISSYGETIYEWDPVSGTTATTVLKLNDLQRCLDYRSSALPYGPFVAANIFEKLYVSQTHGPLLVDCDDSRCKVKPLMKNEDLCICKAYIWRGQISFSITAGTTTIVSVGQQIRQIPWPSMLKCTSATLFGNVFIVGTKLGQILFFPLKCPDDLLQLDPNSYKQKLFIGKPESIIHVGVRVQNNLHNFPDVVAATRSKLFCFRASGFVQ